MTSLTALDSGAKNTLLNKKVLHKNKIQTQAVHVAASNYNHVTCPPKPAENTQL